MSGGRSGVGLALGPRFMAAATKTAVWTRELPEGADGLPDPVELARGLAELREELGGRVRRLRIVLLPPLVAHRWLELPRAREEEIGRVVAASAGKYFTDALAPQAIAVSTDPGARGSPRSYQVAAAAEPLVERVLAAAGDAGWRVVTMGSAYAAWEAAALRRWPALAAGSAAVLVQGEERTDALVFQSGRVRLARRFPRPWSPARILEQLATRRAGILGSDEQCGGAESLVAAPAEPAFPAAVLAARFAGAARSELVPERVRHLRSAIAARTSRRLYAAAAALLLVTAGLELWGAHRELGRLRAARVSRQDQVARALSLRDGIAAVETRVKGVRAAEVRASRWGPIIAGVALHLPGDAHLVGFSGTDDSLRLEGLASRAAGVFGSLQRVPRIAEVRADAPIRQEARDSGPPVEYFSAAARIANGAR